MKILYNVTINIDEDIHDEWLDWMTNEHIPEVMNTKCFYDAKLSKIDGEEHGGRTYSIMYIASNRNLYDQYVEKHAKILQQKTQTKYEGKIASFRTVLEVLEHFKADE
ncbi:MAG: DUF4286 family protein [Flavobacteriia bacterium]|nr:DUF4286 family protein [Flavobacteriia bacterium]